MANEENLIPMDERTENEQREIARKGGKKSGEARRRRNSPDAIYNRILAFPNGKICIPQLCNEARCGRVYNDAFNLVTACQLLNPLQILGIGELFACLSAAVVVFCCSVGGCAIITPKPSREGV